jgi:hypothetical protein
VVLSTNPANLTSGVAVNTTISATLSETIAASAPAITLAQAGTAVPGSVVLAGTTATFTPTTKLGTSLTYTATATSAIKDLAGNPLATAFAWTFTTSACNAITLAKQFTLSGVASTAGFKALATDGSSIYLWTQADFSATSGNVYKIDPTSGQVLSTTTIPLVPMAPTSPVNGIQFIADVAWHNGALWASGTYIAPGPSFPQGVFRVNLATGLAEVPVPAAPGLPGEVPILQGLASDGTNLYAAIDRNYANPSPTTHVIVKFNPATSTQVPLGPALLTTAGQAIRLDYGAGSLWVFDNPNVQQVNPASGVSLATYCKTDGGANILYLNGYLWTIKDVVLMAYSLP